MTDKLALAERVEAAVARDEEQDRRALTRMAVEWRAFKRLWWRVDLWWYFRQQRKRRAALRSHGSGGEG